MTAPTIGAAEVYRCPSDAAAAAALRLSAGERTELLRSVERTLRAYLTGEGGELKITVEIEAKLPEGFNETKMRIVDENARTLKFVQAEFDVDEG